MLYIQYIEILDDNPSLSSEEDILSINEEEITNILNIDPNDINKLYIDEINSLNQIKLKKNFFISKWDNEIDSFLFQNIYNDNIPEFKKQIDLCINNLQEILKEFVNIRIIIIKNFILPKIHFNISNFFNKICNEIKDSNLSLDIIENQLLQTYEINCINILNRKKQYISNHISYNKQLIKLLPELNSYLLQEFIDIIEYYDNEILYFIKDINQLQNKYVNLLKINHNNMAQVNNNFKKLVLVLIKDKQALLKKNLKLFEKHFNNFFYLINKKNKKKLTNNLDLYIELKRLFNQKINLKYYSLLKEYCQDIDRAYSTYVNTFSIIKSEQNESSFILMNNIKQFSCLYSLKLDSIQIYFYDKIHDLFFNRTDNINLNPNNEINNKIKQNLYTYQILYNNDCNKLEQDNEINNNLFINNSQYGDKMSEELNNSSEDEFNISQETINSNQSNDNSSMFINVIMTIVLFMSCIFTIKFCSK